MDKYICSCCGGKVNRVTMTCEYCGTQYKEENNNLIRLETFRNPVQTLAAKFQISHEHILQDPKMISEYAIKRLANNFADVIAPYMDVYHSYDPCTKTHSLDARIKVVIPINKPTVIW